MPDPWEYPWFAAWDLGFHAVAWAHLDPAFAKYQLRRAAARVVPAPERRPARVRVELRRRQPAGARAGGAARLPDRRPHTDREFLERIFQKLLVNFTWWVNREDADGNNVFSGGFLGLDNISPIDRSNLPEGVALEQADGTAWMAYYALSMLVIALELAEENDVYLDMVIKFLEQFVLDRAGARAAGPLRRRGRVLLRPARPARRARRPRSRCRRSPGLIPVLPAVRPVGASAAEAATRLGKRFARLRDELGGDRRKRCVGRIREVGDERTLLVSVINPDELRQDVAASSSTRPAFLSPHGLRAVSKRYEGNPYTLDGVPGAWIDYEPAESTTTMFGGNSNWRGADLDAGQLPRDPPVHASTSASSATTSRSSTRPARGRSARFG